MGSGKWEVLTTSEVFFLLTSDVSPRCIFFRLMCIIPMALLCPKVEWEVLTTSEVFFLLTSDVFPALHFFQIDVHHPHGVVVPESGK